MASLSFARSAIRMPALSLPGLSTPVLLALLAVYTIWSSTYLVLGQLVAHVPPMTTSGVRFVLAGSLLYAFSRLRGASGPTAKQWAMSAVTGALMFLVGNGLVAVAAREVPSAVTAMSAGSVPLFLAAMEAGLGKRLPTRHWLGLGLGFAGVLCMGLADAQASPRAALLLVLAPLGWAAGSLCVRRADLPAGPMAGATQMLCAGAMMLCAGLATGERFTGMPPSAAVAAFAYLVVFGSVVGFSACLYLLRHAPASIATSYAYVNPVAAAGLGALVGGEQLAGETWLAGALVVAGVAILVTGPRRD
jgi:drug/metabolite transporter (DMT)-like permease